jgi:hypothetical protein
MTIEANKHIIGRLNFAEKIQYSKWQLAIFCEWLDFQLAI